MLLVSRGSQNGREHGVMTCDESIYESPILVRTETEEATSKKRARKSVLLANMWLFDTYSVHDLHPSLSQHPGEAFIAPLARLAACAPASDGTALVALQAKSDKEGR